MPSRRRALAAPPLAALACLGALAGLAGVARASLPPVATADTKSLSAPGDASKSVVFSDADDVAAKLPVRAKIKECCGYPIAAPEGFRLSFYWLAYESDYANEAYETTIYSRDGYPIGRYPQAFVYELILEGSGILRDGRVLNYDGECRWGVGTCFKTLELGEHPLGRGVQNRPLEPFRSIAVDPRFIPIGAAVYVPELVGVVLPDGTRHDGCLRADDQGGAIKLHKMDFFVESYPNFKYLADQLYWRLKATPHLDEPRCEYLRLGVPRERDNDHTDWAMLHSSKYRQALARSKVQQRARDRQVLTASLGLRSHRGAHGAGKATGKHASSSGSRHAGKRGDRGHTPLAHRGR